MIYMIHLDYRAKGMLVCCERLESEDGLVGHRAQVDDAVVQPHVLAHGGQRRVSLKLRLAARGVRQLQRQDLRAADAEDLLHTQLLSATAVSFLHSF